MRRGAFQDRALAWVLTILGTITVGLGTYSVTNHAVNAEEIRHIQLKNVEQDGRLESQGKDLARIESKIDKVLDLLLGKDRS